MRSKRTYFKDIPRHCLPDMSDAEYSIRVLMYDPSIPGKAQLKPEDRISIAFADRMRPLVSEHGPFRGIWHHPANEAKRHRFDSLILLRQGMLMGIADHMFSWVPREHSTPQGLFRVAGIEFKVPEERGASPRTGKDIQLRAKTEQKHYQEHFQRMIEVFGGKYRVAYSADEAFEALYEWEALPRPDNRPLVYLPNL